MRFSAGSMLCGLLLSTLVNAQTIQPGDVVSANFNSVAEFQSLSARGWIFRDGDGVGSATCANPGDIASCGWGFAEVDGVRAARALSQASSQVRRWIITPPITFAAGGSVTFRLRKDNFGAGAFDLRQSDGQSDTGDQQENGIDLSPDGSAACLPGQGSFCLARRVRSSGVSDTTNDPPCSATFTGGANVGIRTQEFCSFTVPASELEPTLTGVHRLAFMMRTRLSNVNGPGLLLDSITITAGGPRRPDQALIYTLFSNGSPQLGLSRHGFNSYGSFVALGASNSRQLFGLDSTPDGAELFAVAAAPMTLVRVDPAIGTQTNIAQISNLIGDGVNASPTDLTIDPRTGQAYLSTVELVGSNFVSRLYDLNLSNGAALLRGNLNSNDVSLLNIDLAISCTGQMYGHDIAGDRLLSINRGSGQATAIGLTGVDANFAQGMDFNNTTGLLHGWVIGGTQASPVFHGYGTFNLSTGAFSAQSNSPLATIEGSFPEKCWLFRDGFQG